MTSRGALAAQPLRLKLGTQSMKNTPLLTTCEMLELSDTARLHTGTLEQERRETQTPQGSPYLNHKPLLSLPAFP